MCPDRVVPLAVCIALMFLPVGAEAQTPVWELSGGYAYLNDPPDATSFTAGWAVGAAIGLTRWSSAVVEGSYDWKTISEIHLNTSAVMAGARAFTGLGPFTEFAQIEAGAARAGSSVFGLKSSSTAFALQAGAGLDYPIAQPFAARFQVDYRLVPHLATDLNSQHFVRVLVALVYIHGAR
jgi:hypothetical protein